MARLINAACRRLLTRGVPAGMPSALSRAHVRQRMPMGRATQLRLEKAGRIPTATLKLGPQYEMVPTIRQLLCESQPEVFRAIYGVPFETETDAAREIKAEAIADGLIDDDGTPAAAAA